MRRDCPARWEGSDMLLQKSEMARKMARSALSRTEIGGILAWEDLNGARPIRRSCRRRGPSLLRVAWLMSATLLWLCAPGGASNANAAAAFVQVSAATPQSNQSQVSVTYLNAQAAGDTNILAIGWNDATSNI